MLGYRRIRLRHCRDSCHHHRRHRPDDQRLTNWGEVTTGKTVWRIRRAMGKCAFSEGACFLASIASTATGANYFFVFETGWVFFIEHLAFALTHALSASAIGMLCSALAQIVFETLFPVILDDLAMFETTSRATRFIVVAAILLAV